MHRPTSLSVLILTLLAAALPASLSAQPIVTGLPTDKSAFVGTPNNANVTFDVAAFSADSGTLSYQWGTVASSVFTAIPADNATYNGSATANLTVNTTSINQSTLNGTQYKCEITEGSNTVTTPGATINIYSAPTLVPTLTLSSTTVAANSTANITLTIGNLSAGDTVKVQRFLDRFGNGTAVIKDPLVQSFTVTENQTTSFDGVTDPVIPGDDLVHTPNGTITTHINLSNSNESGQISGNYVIKISSSTGEFIPITQILTVTQPAYVASVSGQVTSNSVVVPYAPVALLQSSDSGQNQTFMAGTLTDINGDFTIHAPISTAGDSYLLLGFVAGNVAPFSTAPSFTLTNSTPLTGQNIAVTPATCMIFGKTQDSVTSHSIASVQFFAQGSTSQSIALSLSDSNGDFVIPVVADTWKMDTSDTGLPPLGYLKPQNKPTADTTAGNANVLVSLEAVNALIYGTLTNGSNPIPGVLMDADDNASTYEASGTSNTTGYYVIGVNGATSTGTNVNVNADTDNGTQAALAGLVPFSGNSYQIYPDTATQANFNSPAVTAYLNGTVTDISNTTLLANLPIQIESTNNSNYVQIQTTTDSNGEFSFGVFGGTWNIQLGYGNGNTTQDQTLSTLVGESLNEVATDGTNTNGIAYSVLNATSNITGTVVDSNDQDVSNTNIVAQTSTTIGGLSYTSYTNTDNNGFYTLPVVNGTWNVYPGPQIYESAMVTITSANTPSSPAIQNFSPSPYLLWVQSTFGDNQLGDPNTATETPAHDGIPNLVKYAFNLNPTTNQQANLPHPTLSGGKLTLAFTQQQADLTYTVQSSTDLSTWSTTDPNLSVVTNDQQVTATYNLATQPIAFLRILVTVNY
jgi:hypothetical protein